MECWESLSELGYPDYSISDQGRVRSYRTGRILNTSSNQSGTVKIGLVHPGAQKQNTFSVAVLVATAFVPRMENCTHVIHLDGNKANNWADNLEWRPWWVAKQYHRQFIVRREPSIIVPIKDVATGRVYNDSWDACRAHGLLDRYVYMSVVNGSGVYPYGQHFVLA